jgi:hypothetical protein
LYPKLRRVPLPSARINAIARTAFHSRPHRDGTQRQHPEQNPSLDVAPKSASVVMMPSPQSLPADARIRMREEKAARRAPRCPNHDPSVKSGRSRWSTRRTTDGRNRPRRWQHRKPARRNPHKHISPISSRQMLARDPPCPRPSAASCKGVTDAVQAARTTMRRRMRFGSCMAPPCYSLPPHALVFAPLCASATYAVSGLIACAQLGRRRMMQMGGVRVYCTGGRETAERSNGPAARSPITG